MYYITAGAVAGCLTSFVYCKLNGIKFTKDINGIRQGNVVFFIGAVTGTVIGTYCQAIENAYINHSI